MGQPTDWWLSTEAVIAQVGSRPNWTALADEHGLQKYVPSDVEKVNKATYKEAIEQYLCEHEVTYGESSLQFLSDWKELLACLPAIYLLPAITDYSSETDRRVSSTIFHRLMAMLSDRILRVDTRYSELEKALQTVRELLNERSAGADESQLTDRLGILSTFEESLQTAIARLIPTVDAVHLQVTIDNVTDLFAKGVSLEIDDGVRTDVLAKGHGLQRSVVFGLLQVLMALQRDGELSKTSTSGSVSTPLILIVEEPELYIHPQGRRMVYKVLNGFSQTDQVIYSTHEPEFIDVSNFHRIALVRKNTPTEGTYICQCDEGAITAPSERKLFQLFSSFSADWNRIFFANKVVLIEGDIDRIALVTVGRHLGLFDEIPEEIDYTLIVAGSKDEIPKLQAILNPFKIPYKVLLELDGEGEDSRKNRLILDLAQSRRCVKMPNRLEDIAGYEGHLSKKHTAIKHFANAENVTEELRKIVLEIFEQDLG